MTGIRERVGELKLRKRDFSGHVFIAVYRDGEPNHSAPASCRIWLMRVIGGAPLDEHEVFTDTEAADLWAREAVSIWPDLAAEDAAFIRT